MEHGSTTIVAPEQPITEQSNPLSTNIDVASPTEIASILYACDKEIFNGWMDSQGLNDKLVHEKMYNIARKISQVMKEQNGSVVISGCGTSGRLAYLTTKTFNRYLKSCGRTECFQYLIAGGDRALFRSVELAEDDPVAGALELKKVTESKTDVVFIGVTCGLSAPYVAGQLDYCLSRLDKFTPVLIGFNKIHQARNVAIEKWDKTFLQIAQEMETVEKSSNAFILNPIIGPEPVTGSSRMKSGTATRIILDILSITAVHDYPQYIIPQLVTVYEKACHQLYKYTERLGSLIQLAGSCLISRGHIYYLGSDGFGPTAMIDASECVPTFSASFHDIRGFVDGGFMQLDNNDGDLSDLGPEYRISVKNFVTDVFPLLQSNDLVVLLGQDLLNQFETTLATIPCKKAAIFFTSDDGNAAPETQVFDLVLTISCDIRPLTDLTPTSVKVVLDHLLQETSLKWIVNGLSTGAHILRGKVYHNIMIDVRVSNSKLFYRAVGIVQKYCCLTQEDSISCLLRSIYSTDCLTDLQKSSQVVDHIMAASQQEQVVPVAILLASLHCSVDEAKHMIRTQPIISQLFKSHDQNYPIRKVNVVK